MLSPIYTYWFMLMCSSPQPLGSRPGNCPDSATLLARYYRRISASFAIGSAPALSMANLPSRFLRKKWLKAMCLALVCAAATVRAASLNDLLEQKDLTPQGLAHVISDFSFELTPRLQEADSFLQRKRGDCADFANLASLVLSRRGYTTKLVVVMMSKQTHVVCFIKEAGGFLDYNHRADVNPVIASDGSLEDIAEKVAGDFRSDWRMASYFRYRESSPVYLDSVFATASSSKHSAGPRQNGEANATFPAKSAGPAQASTSLVGVQAMIN
jgi:hypothetical protein